MNYRNIEYVATALSAVAEDTGTPAGIRDWATGLLNMLRAPLEPTPQFTKGHALPAGIGALADEYAMVRDRRLSIEKEAAAVKEREMEIYNVILANLSESTDTGAAGKAYRVQLVNKERYNVKDWSEVHKFIQKYGMFELLQRRLADTAVKEYREVNNGQLPDGVATVEVPTLSFNKV